MKFDLHFHTTLSDGRKTSEEVIEIAKGQGLEFLACTDHDIVNTELPRLAQKAGIVSVHGVEISAYEPVSDKHLHITCYAERFSDRVHDIMESTRQGRWVKIQSQILQLQRNGFRIDLPGFMTYFEDQGLDDFNPANGHLCEFVYHFPENIALVKTLTGKEMDRIDFLYACLKREGEYAWIGAPIVPNYEPSVELCGEIASENNAILSIAHPNFTFEKNREDLDRILEPYVESGVQGIEISSSASPEWTDTILRIRKRFDLLLTFGSDCHFKPSPDGKHRMLGELNPYMDRAFMEEAFRKFQSAL